jgi:hypothetical protein
MPDALEPMRQNVEHEAPEELHGVECHRAAAVAPLVVFPAEGDLAVLQGDQTPVGDGYTMGIAREVPQDVLGLTQRLLRIDDPCGTPEGSQEALPGLRRRKALTAPGQCQHPSASGLLEGVQEQPPEAPTEDLHRQEKVWAAGDPPGPVGRQAPSREDTMEMRVMVELICKSWKRCLHLASIKTKKEDTTLWYLYGRMLLIVLTYALYPQMRATVWMKKKRELSVLKVVRHFQASADRWMHAIFQPEFALRRFLQRACATAKRLATKATRKRRTTAQILRESLNQQHESLALAAAVNA